MTYPALTTERWPWPTTVRSWAGVRCGASPRASSITGIEYDAKRPYLVPNAESTRADAFDRSGLWLQAEDDTYTETRGSAAQSCTGYLDATALTAVAV